MGRAAWVAVFLVFGCQRTAASGGPGGSTDPGVDGGPGNSSGNSTTHRWPPPRPGYVNPIPAENANRGDPSWNTGFTNPPRGQLAAYADRVSAKAGDTFNVMAASAPTRTTSWTLFRLGWYDGAGARPLASGSTSIGAQRPCPPAAGTGLVRCSWNATFSVQVPPDAVSGLYVVRIVDDQQDIGVMVPLVVRDDRPADLLMNSAVLTAQAYNAWGGTGLYHPSGAFAVQVSFDRPYDSDSGTGQMLRYEAPMARFLERYGYDVTYTTNLDVTRQGGAAILDRGAYLSVGHDEYWPGEQRDSVEAARNAGMPIYFFGANAAYWKVRLSDPGPDGNARVVTCYKLKPQNDPLAGSPQQTGRFRDEPINRPEEELVGTMYESWMLFGQTWKVRLAAHPFYEGTGLQEGDVIPRLVGYEYDRTIELDTPSPVDVLARSPLVDAEGKPGFSEATIYTAPSGALVFGAGSIYWPTGLDGPLRDGRVERMTANVLHLGLMLPVPEALLSVSERPEPEPDARWATSVATLATGMQGPAGVAQLPDGTFVIADPRAHRILQIDGSGRVSPYAGDGTPSGNPFHDNKPGLAAGFFGPTSVLSDTAGNVYVADSRNHAIRRIGNDAAHTVTTIAGTLSTSGNVDGVGGAARFDFPLGMSWLDAAHIVIADSGNMSLRVLDVRSRSVSTLAIAHSWDESDGPARGATFYWPTAVAVAPDGRIFFIASYTGTLKVVGTDPARTITTLVAGGHGFGDGPGTTARLDPQGGLVWLDGALVVSDPGNRRLRWVSPGNSAATTTVKTWAGNGDSGAADGPASAASFGLPLGLLRGRDGNVYVVDGGAGALRVVRP